MLTEPPEARAQNGEMDLSSDEQPIIFKCNLILKSEVRPPTPTHTPTPRKILLTPDLKRAQHPEYKCLWTCLNY